MANIEIVYEKEFACRWDCEEHCTQCHTMAARDLGCRRFETEDKKDEKGRRIFSFYCKHAEIKYARKGWSGKNYEIGEEMIDDYNPHLNYVEVTLGRTTYECAKVKLDGKVIFNNYDDEPEEDDHE